MTLDGIETWFVNNITVGGAGVWVGVALFFRFTWVGLPAVIEAFANRQSKIEERLGAEMDAMSKRWEERIAAADRSHEDCMKGQEALRNRIDEMDKTISNQNQTIAMQSRTVAEQTQTITDLNAKVAGMTAQAQQTTASVLRAFPDPDNMSPQLAKAVRTLKEIK